MKYICLLQYIELRNPVYQVVNASERLFNEDEY